MTTPVKISPCKRCRRAGEKLFLKGERCNSPKCALVKRNFPPGMHGTKGARKLSNYGQQLKEKQKAKRMYGLREVPFRNYFENSLKKVGNTGEILFRALENRLDNTIYRLGLGSSRIKARQLVGHGHVLVNGKKVDIPSYSVKSGDVITFKDKTLKSKASEELQQQLANKEIVSWLNLDVKTLTGKVTGDPRLGEVEMNVDWKMIVEFYSK